MKKKSCQDVQIKVDQFQVNDISATSGLFFEGPFNVHGWRSRVKSNTGLKQEGSAAIRNLQSILKDNDQMDSFVQKKE